MAVLPVGAQQRPEENADVEYDSDAEEELRLECEEKQNELVELKAEVRASRLEAQQLRLRLQGSLKNSGGAKASNLKMPDASAAPPAVVEDPRVAEFKPLCVWLAEHVDLARAAILDVGLEVAVGGHPTILSRVAQWPLSGTSPELRLSVPEQHQEAMTSLLQSIRSGVGDEELRNFASMWALVPGELAAQTFTRPQNAVLLASRADVHAGAEPPRAHVGFGALVAPWPTAQALDMFRVLNATEGHVPRSGDRVEVQYQGQFYAGTVNSIDTLGRASVRCDVDAPGVYTIAPLCRLRPLNFSCSASGCIRLQSCTVYSPAAGGATVAAADAAASIEASTVTEAGYGVSSALATELLAPVAGPTAAQAAQAPPPPCPAARHPRSLRHRRTRSAM